MEARLRRLKVMTYGWFMLFMLVYVLIIMLFVGCEVTNTNLELPTGEKLSRVRTTFLRDTHIDQFFYTDPTRSFEIKGYKNESRDEIIRALISQLTSP